ncbi:CIC11C00000005578 [Sungouiella intermedia]|uniref:Mitochondrial 15S rRNA processing factor CCM1 n=1 Tax=Sungouiella intermedia TaxID=45354 RepID=A0A1L0BU72_9ASCO|nr:CIC11C00000005578 [[Candida] intermedia]
MLLSVLARGIPRAAVQALRSAALGARWSSVSAQTQPSHTSQGEQNGNGHKRQNGQSARKDKVEVNSQAQNGDKNTSNGARPARRGRNHISNRKVRDISTQVKQSVSTASGAEIGEAIDILEEGISYLREIQAAEQIPDDLLYSVFQPITADLFDKIQSDEAVLGQRTIGLVLNMLVTHKIAHNYHFLKAAEAAIKGKSNLEAYTDVLQIWLTYLEYTKEVGVGRMNFVIKLPFTAYKERNFDSRDLQNLTYFVYVMHCLESGVDYSVKDAMKLLQILETSRVPEKFHVTGTIRRLQLGELKDAVALYEKKINDINTKAMDPNGTFVAQRIQNAITQNNPVMLNTLFEQMKTASVTNEIAITEPTFNRVMNAYIELHRFDEVIDIFRDLLASKGNPSVATWDLVIKAMGHPSHVKDLSGPEKKQMVENVENTVKTMLASGVEMNARTLAVVVGAFANLNRFDLVDEYLKEYKNVPVVHLTRNNILLGLLSNKRTSEAEAKLKEFSAKDSSYVPSTNVMNGFLAHYVDTGNNDAVEGILTYMKQHGIEENVATMTTFISYYFKMYRSKGMVPDVSALLAQLKNSIPYNQFTVTTIIDGLAKDGVNLEAARTMFEHFCKENSRFKYNMGLLTTMIRAELDFGSVASAEDLFEFYVANLRNDTRLWNMMIAALLPKQEKLALNYYNRLLEQAPFKVKPNYYTYYFMLDHFVKSGNNQRIQWTLDEIAKADLSELGGSLPRMISRLRLKFELAPTLKEKVTQKSL